jgi:hypothetical protein
MFRAPPFLLRETNLNVDSVPASLFVQYSFHLRGQLAEIVFWRANFVAPCAVARNCTGHLYDCRAGSDRWKQRR